MNSATQTSPRAKASGPEGKERRDRRGGAAKARAEALCHAAEIERAARRHHDALALYEEAAGLFEATEDDARLGPFRAAYADLLALVGESEGREDYLERAAEGYAAAALHFGRAGLTHAEAAAEHDLARLCLARSRHAAAHEHLERAMALLDGGVDRARAVETRARLLLAEGRAEEGADAALEAVSALEAGGDSAELASALTARGVALARLARYEEAQEVLGRAATVAALAGDAWAEGQAALAFAEELGGSLPVAELSGQFERAASLLKATPGQATSARLVSCARRLIARAADGEQPHSWEGFSFREAVHRFEAGVIGRALSDAGGSVSRAAYLLGFRHHNSLASIINNRHRELLGERSPIRPRRRSIMTGGGRARGPRPAKPEAESAGSVLHVEDDRTVSDAVRVALEADGWRVETCADGADALERLRRPTPYDLVVLDYDLPGLDGVRLASAARALRHRRMTPIIMFSAADREREALPAGVNLFLRKPHDAPRLAAAARRLLPKKK